MPAHDKSRDLTSSSLLYRVKQDDQEAWELLVEVYSPLVFYWCRHKSGLSPDDAADVMQEVFRSVAISIPNFRKQKSGTFRGWLRTITTNKIRDGIRKQKNRGQADAVGGTRWNQQLHELPETDSDEMQATEEGLVMGRALELLMKNFKERNRQAFWLVTTEGWTAAEAAEKLGMTEQAVWQSCFRIRRRLREELEGLLDQESTDSKTGIDKLNRNFRNT